MNRSAINLNFTTNLILFNKTRDKNSDKELFCPEKPNTYQLPGGKNKIIIPTVAAVHL